jgi:hypothetical protein
VVSVAYTASVTLGAGEEVAYTVLSEKLHVQVPNKTITAR